MKKDLLTEIYGAYMDSLNADNSSEELKALNEEYYSYINNLDKRCQSAFDEFFSLIVGAAEEQGFKEGFRYAVRLLNECR